MVQHLIDEIGDGFHVADAFSGYNENVNSTNRWYQYASICKDIKQKQRIPCYVIMLRGINRTEIFFDDEDRNRFIDTLQRMKEKGEYEIYAYCLMDNHVHLLIKEKREPINRAMKRIGVSYAYYFNKKYGRVGHLFQDRYRSEAVEKETYLLAAVRYIHNNPVIAGLVKRAGDYPWSSYRCYVKGKTGTGGLVESENVLGIFAKDRNKAVRLFEEYTLEGSSREFIDIEEYQRLGAKRLGARNLTC